MKTINKKNKLSAVMVLLLTGGLLSPIGLAQEEVEEPELGEDPIHSNDLDPLSDSDAFSYNQRYKARKAVLQLLKLEGGDYVSYCRLSDADNESDAEPGETPEEECEVRVRALVNHMFTAAQRHNLDPWVMVAVSLENTRFNPFYRSSRGVAGVMGIPYQRRWRRGKPFFTSRDYRLECHSKEDACQMEIIFHSAMILENAIEECQDDTRLGLQKFMTGRCHGNPRFARHVNRWRERLMDIADTIEDVNVCEIHPLVCSDPLAGIDED